RGKGLLRSVRGEDGSGGRRFHRARDEHSRPTQTPAALRASVPALAALLALVPGLALAQAAEPAGASAPCERPETPRVNLLLEPLVQQVSDLSFDFCLCARPGAWHDRETLVGDVFTGQGLHLTIGHVVTGSSLALGASYILSHNQEQTSL